MNPNRNQTRALVELQSKTLKEIQVETAITWAYRAWAARQLDNGDYTEYLHEALEHAALSGDDELLRTVRAIVQGD